MSQIVLTSMLLIAVLVPQVAAQEIAASSAPVPGWSLLWPVTLDDRGVLGNDYAQYNYVVPLKHHTGIDIGVGKGTAVRAAAGGTLHLVQGNDTTCASGAGCQDHGYGTTIILRHDVSGGTYYTQYSHLSRVEPEILEKCGPVTTQPFRRQCSGASVEAGKVIALSGSTCKGKENCDPHLHFEVKTFGTLGTEGHDRGEFGYTSAHPDAIGYHDPVVNLHTVTAIHPTVVTISGGLALRVGPGGAGNTRYRAFHTLEGGLYRAIATAPATSSPACSSGWYQILNVTQSRFPDASRAGGMTEGWTCGDYVTTEASRKRVVTPPSRRPEDSCRQYDAAFEEAAARFGVPSNLLRAMGMHESGGCKQQAWGGNGCGIMQLDGSTREHARDLLVKHGLLPAGTTDLALCEPDAVAARLNILGGAAILATDKKRFALPLLSTGEIPDDIGGIETLAIETTADDGVLANTIESWWFAVAAYNGAGADLHVFTSNYPSRVWPHLEAFMGTAPSYPPLHRMRYVCSDDRATTVTHNGRPYSVRWAEHEANASDDAREPRPAQFGAAPCRGIRWVDPDFNALDEMPVLHRNDGSVHSRNTDVPIEALAANQLAGDTREVLPKGAASVHGVIFTATLAGAPGQSIDLEVEVRAAGAPFLASKTASARGVAGQAVSVPVTLPVGSYRWQYRAKSTSPPNGESRWKAFGSFGAADFIIAPVGPTPAITSLTPNPVPGADERQTLTIRGSGFALGATVLLRTGSETFEIPPERTTLVSSTELTISANVTNTAADWTAEVRNADGKTSGQFAFRVVATSNERPAVTGVAPNPVFGSSSPQPLTIFGTNFRSGASVVLRSRSTGATIEPLVESQSATRIVVSATFPAIAQTWAAQVVNAGNAGSNEYEFEVTVPAAEAPAITGVSPNPVTGSDAAQPFTIDGRNFLSGCSVTLRNRTTGGVFANQPIASRSSTRIVIHPVFTTAAHRWSVQVVNPGGDASNEYEFDVVASQVTPSVSSVAPTSMTADGVNKQLTIFGSNFESGNVVQFKWGVPPNAGVWNPGSSAPTINNAGRITVSMNPGTVNDTIYVRVCRSASQTGSGDCSSGTHSVNVTAESSAPSVSSLSPTSMTADGVNKQLTIFGSNFESGNVVQFKWGVPPNAGVWNPSSGAPTINNSGRITVTMNPGTVNDTIYVRVCRSASQTGSDDCSSGTHAVTVTAEPSAPSVSSLSPTSMTADGVNKQLTINGSNFQSGTVVQFKWGVPPNAGVWNPSSSTPTINNSGRITVSMNPGTVNDTIYVRVCRSASQTGSGDCSSGTHAVTVTAEPSAPSVSSLSPTSMTADGVNKQLTINGSNFQSGNVVQFKWGVPPNAGVWNPSSSTPSINSSQITISMNPGTVNDTIYVRVCRSSSQTGSGDCSSGTHAVTVTAPQQAPSVSSISPTTMTADGANKQLTINGSNFQSGNVVQFKWGVPPNAGVWNSSSGAPSINGSSQITISMNPGTVNDTIYVRVCRSSSQTGSGDCSSGTHAVTVTAPQQVPSVSSISPTTMSADGANKQLTINGSNFENGNVVQFKWGVPPNAGVWNPSSGAPTINTSSQITISMNPGTVNDTIYVRVCRSSSQTGSGDCSSGTHAVTVTAPQQAPSVSSVSPTSMTADGANKQLTIFGSNFQSGNVVQFKWGVPPNAGVWNPSSSSPSLNGSSQITISMNPGTVNDTIYIRVCRSSSQTGSGDCSSGTHAVTVTAPQQAPSVSSVSPTSMTADGASKQLTINGSNFQSGNVVQFKWGVPPNAGVWNPSSSSPSINSSGQITISMNPGTVNDTIYVRVCRSSSQTGSGDCSSGTHAVTVTAAQPAPSVSSISPTTMTANGISRQLTINGSNFRSGNVVQFKWNAPPGAGVWNSSSGTPSINSSSQITINMNPGTVNDTIYVRVCRSSSQTSAGDCSAGTHSVTVVK